MKKISEEKLKHHLNTALRNVLEEKEVKIHPDLSMDFPLENDYYELLTKFEQHIDLTIKINKEVKK